MRRSRQMQIRCCKFFAIVFAGLLLSTGARAALFEDDEARKAILDLRQRVEAIRIDADQIKKSSTDESSGSVKSLLDLQRQIELLRVEISALRGTSEQLSRELTEIQKQQKDQSQRLTDRLSKLEPSKVSVDGIEFSADPTEKRDYESALSVFRKGDFALAQNLFVGFIGRFPGSGYTASALFWLGNAQYATRDYKEAIINFRALVARNPGHMRAPEAVLSIANCQVELKDLKAARKSFGDLIKTYPNTEAAGAAKERLAALK